MLDKLKNIKYEAVKRITAISIEFTSNDPVYHLLKVKKVGTSITIEEELLNSTFDDVVENASKNNTFLLHFSGKGILSKQVANKGNYLKEIIFSSPAENFYIYEAHEAQGNFVSVARKEQLDEEFQKFKENGFQVLDYSLGPFVSYHIHQVGNINKVGLQGYELDYMDANLMQFARGEENTTVLVDEHRLQSKSLGAFATVLQYLFPIEKIHYDSDHLAEERETFKFKRLFNLTGVGMIVFFLAALLLSLAAQNYYNNKFLGYTSQLNNLNDTYNKVKDLKDEITKKQAVLNESGILNNSFLSQYVNELGASVPKTIELISLELNPLKNRLKQAEKLEFYVNELHVSGATQSSGMLNYWVKELKKMKWVKKIEIIEFKRNRKQVGEFTVKIEI